MFNGNGVNIELINGIDRGYLIKDKHGITIGRISVIELSIGNRYCCARIKFYKEDQEGEQYLSEIIKIFIESLFKEMNIYKINILADEEICTRPFVELGFILEGIISDSISSKNFQKNELNFGINYSTYNNLNTTNVLRIYGRDIELKILTVDDAKEMQEYYKRNKDHLSKYEPKRDTSFYSLEAQRQILIENYKQFLNGTGVNFGIFKDKKLIGKIQISGIIIGVFQSGIVGYSLDEKHQGKGYMKEALQLVLEYAFEEMGLHRIEASTLVDNERSQAVLKSCRFEELGINKKYLFINGKWKDHITFYKINEK